MLVVAGPLIFNYGRIELPKCFCLHTWSLNSFFTGTEVWLIVNFGPIKLCDRCFLEKKVDVSVCYMGILQFESCENVLCTSFIEIEEVDLNCFHVFFLLLNGCLLQHANTSKPLLAHLHRKFLFRGTWRLIEMAKWVLAEPTTDTVSAWMKWSPHAGSHFSQTFHGIATLDYQLMVLHA